LLKKIKKILYYFKFNFLRKIHILFNINQKTLIGGRELILPPGHLLKYYNVNYPRYDKFISEVVKRIDKEKSVIDIGANIGDTLLRFYNSNSKLRYYSIEADSYFFKYLKINKEKMSLGLDNKITLINNLVGENLVGNLSKTNTGTKTLIENSEGIKTKPLDEIILENNINKIALIKIDVDGYDYNVLKSGINQIKKHKPDLFFEYMSLNESGYINIINELNQIGYNDWSVLNNYGEVIFEDKNYDDVLEIIKTYTKDKISIDVYCKYNKYL
jgi:FkbM family methyltransferase|tara:strand:+ start:285 stop:1100 length:816 start_codon:yes stop_codon:yes gene_type:complete